VATSGTALHGQATTGYGVVGRVSSGVALNGSATNAAGFALKTSGRLSLAKASGVATILATKDSVLVTPGLDVTASSFVLLTPKADLGTRRLWYTTDPTNNRFTIKLSSAVTTDTRIGWLLLG
jgi:hypothetical protein